MQHARGVCQHGRKGEPQALARVTRVARRRPPSAPARKCVACTGEPNGDRWRHLTDAFGRAERATEWHKTPKGARPTLFPHSTHLRLRRARSWPSAERGSGPLPWCAATRPRWRSSPAPRGAPACECCRRLAWLPVCCVSLKCCVPAAAQAIVRLPAVVLGRGCLSHPWWGWGGRWVGMRAVLDAWV